jgi:hypothetical protein
MSKVPATWEVEIGRIKVQRQPRQKVPEIPSQTTSWVWWCMSAISVTHLSAQLRLIEVQASLVIKQTLSQK